jgi:hypothetical protein
MKKKIQMVLSILLLTLIFVFYIIFFKSEKKISTQQPDETTIQKKDGANIIEKLRYVSEDITGNKYTIIADSAVAGIQKSDLAELSGVTANIVLNDNSTIYITSDSAIYNQISNNTSFFGNVKVVFEDNEVYSNNIDLNFEKNLIEIYGNVFYMNSNNKLYADKILLNILNKNLKIIMENEKDNILIINNYSK